MKLKHNLESVEQSTHYVSSSTSIDGAFVHRLRPRVDDFTGTDLS